ncbi:N-acetylglucosamine kinase [Aureimonas jatrophae]|uniref:BadF-type ATPase n=1 Tax=Aureimonas jatrophae TaxID=1166073 RepID=A0A1H0JNU4_9HYPH|nr:BadF/BadG/BcrA/BcrD ATPase family protein [Aureimonas jatrophae]SDO45396.1 BadF-type ATPase [Aureimonas jatrophae]
MFLGVDGGGTKTAFCILDETGAVRARTEGETCYFLRIGLDEAERRVAKGVEDACHVAGIAPDELTYAFFGLPAYGEVSSVIDRLNHFPRTILGHDRYECGNDTVCGWAGSLGAADGINIVAGTGSISYGVNEGVGRRCGGWGEIFGDEGSAYWIGRAALQAFSRMSDGREPPSPLLERLSAYLALGVELDIVDVVLNQWAGDRTRIAGLARVVDDAAASGDPQSIRILDEAARELALLLRATREALDFDENAVVAVSYSGGVFRSRHVLDAFRRELAAGPHFELRQPLYEPVVGAALYAARLAGTVLTPRTA